jgi:hypothetical protein
MTIEAEHRAIENALAEYRNRLDTIPDELFELTPPDGGWSYAEVYSHILQATIGASIALEKCTMNSCLPTGKGRSLIGLFVLTLGRFPGRVKAPAAVLERNPVKKLSKEEARNLIVKCRKRIDTVAALIFDSKPKNRVKHPRMGMLNARQWFKFILIHLNHHIKQLNRLEKNLHTA